MSIDTATPRTRRAIIAGAFGGLLATAASFVHAPETRAGTDGDVILDDTNTGASTTEINATSSNPAFRVLGGTVGIRAVGGIGIDAAGSPAVSAIADAAGGIGTVAWSQGDGEGLIGRSTNGTAADPTASPKTGVHGIAEQDDAAARGVYGLATTGQGVRGVASSGAGIAGVSGSGPGVDAASTSGLAVHAVSTLGHAVRGRGQLDGVIGESASGRSGIVGYSGGGTAPAGPAKTGVYGEATQDAVSRGVSGFTLAGQGVRGDATTGQGVLGVATTGQGVKGTATTGDAVLGQSTSGKSVHGVATTGQAIAGEATTGYGVRAVATTGLALDVAGRARFSRSGRVSVPVNRSYVDVTVPGGLASTAMVFALLQYPRSGVYVTSARPNYPSTGKVRIYLSKVASTTATTPLAWFALG
jgi:hypothetical protein